MENVFEGIIGHKSKKIVNLYLYAIPLRHFSRTHEYTKIGNLYETYYFLVKTLLREEGKWDRGRGCRLYITPIKINNSLQGWQIWIFSIPVVNTAFTGKMANNRVPVVMENPGRFAVIENEEK